MGKRPTAVFTAATGRTYLRRGWDPFPIWGGEKGTHDVGITGYAGRPITDDDMEAWDGRPCNTAVRLRHDQIGIDVDGYVGADLGPLIERLGPLPPTVITTSRDDPERNGIRLYRLPPEYAQKATERVWVDKLAPHIEVVRFAHRHAMAWPSIHPKRLEVYRAYDQRTDTDTFGPLPPAEKLPLLPLAWCEALIKPARESQPGGDQAADAFWTAGKPCRTVTATLAAVLASLPDGRHDGMARGLVRLARHGEQGHRGTEAARDQLYDAFMAEVGDERGRDSEAEWERAVFGAENEVERDGWTPVADRGCCPLTDDDIRDWTDTFEVKGLVRSMSEMKQRPPMEWLAVGWVPKQLTVLVGNEGIGKSLFWVRLAAAVTTGRGLPEIGLAAGPPRDVLVIVTEDDPGEVRSRLELAGADMNRMHMLSENDDGTGLPDFPAAFGEIAVATERLDLALVVVDVWLDTVESRLTVKDGQQARQALAPWGALAVEKNCAVLLVAHTNRTKDNSLRDRVGSTDQLRKKARVLLHAVAKGDGGMVVGPDKSNSAGIVNAVEYKIAVTQVRPKRPVDPGTAAALDLVGETMFTISEHVRFMEDSERNDKRGPSAVDRAITWLRDFLTAAAGGSAPGGDVQSHASDAGHSRNSLDAAAKALGVIKKQHRGGGSTWSLPVS